MSASREKLFEVAVRPLGDDAEMRLAAVALLGRLADGKPGDGVGDGAEAVARWERVDAAEKRTWPRWLFLGLLAVLSVWAWSVAGREALTYGRWENVSAGYRYDPGPPYREALTYGRWENVSAGYRYDPGPPYREAMAHLEKCLPGNLTDAQRLLLLGNTGAVSRVDAMRALWQSDPENPAFHMEYVVSEYEHEWGKPASPELLENARRLDPGNSWPLYLSGADELGRAVKLQRPYGTPKRWDIVDQGKLDRGLALLHEASKEPRFDTYQEHLVEMRKDLLPVEDHLGYLVAHKVAWFGWWANQEPAGYLAMFWSAAAAKSQQQVTAGDKEGFVSLMADLQVLHRRWLESGVISSSSESAYSQAVWDGARGLHASALSLGLTEEAARLEKMVRPKAREAPEVRVEYDWFNDHSSTLLSSFWGFYFEACQPPWSAEEMRPGRMADHELLSRGCSLVLWLVFALVLAGMAIYQIRLSRLLRRLAGRVGQLLDAGDHLRITGGGVVLPYLVVMAVIRFTPFGGLDFSFAGNHKLLPAAHYGCLMVIMIVLPIILVRHRLALRAGLLGVRMDRIFWPGFAVVFAACLVPAIGWAASDDAYRATIPSLALLVLLFLLPAIIGGCRAIFTSCERRLLRTAVASRALMPAYATAMLLMVLAAHFHKAAERSWFRKDTTMTTVPGFPGFPGFPGISPYDYRVAEEMRANIREMPKID